MTDLKKPSEKVKAKRVKEQEKLTAELLKQLKKNFDLHHATYIRLSKSSLEVFIINDEKKKSFRF